MDSSELVKLYEKVGKLKGWNDYKLAKALGITQTQLSHYKKNPISTRELMLVKLQQVSGLSIEEIWDLLEKEALAEESKRIKKKIDNLKRAT